MSTLVVTCGMACSLVGHGAQSITGMVARHPRDGATFMQLGPALHRLPPTCKKNCFCVYKVLSEQTVSAVSFLEMAQRDGDCQGGGGWVCSAMASYVWLLWCECHSPSVPLHLLENSHVTYDCHNEIILMKTYCLVEYKHVNI